MIHTINMQNVINPDIEMHFAFHTQIDERQYPQTHDFYEITFITSGSMEFILNDRKFEMRKGDLLLIRPRDVHSKISIGPCTHINLAFPDKTLTSLYLYLYDRDQNDLLSMKSVPVCNLSSHETTYLHNKLMRLNLIPITSSHEVKACLRTILVEIVSQYIMKEISKNQKANKNITMPLWLKQALSQLDSLDDYSKDIDFLVRITNKTPEHICRAFRKYLHLTPTVYINGLRLNYSANLLVYSDKKIIDIAYESGFQSLSYFHHLFKREFNKTPLQYRNSSYNDSDFTGRKMT